MTLSTTSLENATLIIILADKRIHQYLKTHPLHTNTHQHTPTYTNAHQHMSHKTFIPPQQPITQSIELKPSIRRSLRLKRQALPFRARQKKSEAAMRQFVSHPLFQRCHKIAAYWPVEGEMDPSFIWEKAWEMHKKCYLPVLHPFKTRQLLFAEYQRKDTLMQNRYKILQPKLSLHKPIPPWHLDIILVPVVAFDEKGHRLGRGAGYYDHTFEYLQRRGSLQRPKLIGLAYEFQQIEAIPKKPWDIPLAGIITEKRFITFAN